jgi:hypothetical protein
VTSSRDLAKRALDALAAGATALDMTEREQRRAVRYLRRREARNSRARAFGFGIFALDTYTGVACPVCRAEEGRECASRSGRRRAKVHRARRNFSNATKPRCEACGACCLARVWGDGTGRSSDPFVFLYPDESLPEEFLQPAEGGARALHVIDGRCAALRGPLPGARCGVYERRPLTCQAFEPGSYRCRVARARAWLGPHVRGA